MRQPASGWPFVPPILGLLAACALAAPPATPVGFAIDGDGQVVPVGGGLPLQVKAIYPGGARASLPPGWRVTWTSPSTVTATYDDPAEGLVPATGDLPLAVFVSNPCRPDHGADLDGVLFALDTGTSGGGPVSVGAQIQDASGTSIATVSAIVQLIPPRHGNPIHGQQLWTSTCACDMCHGFTGDGSVGAAPDARFPAPALNDTTGTNGPAVAADPSWTLGLFGMAVCSDMDNQGVALRLPMPDWQRAQLSAQDMADLYAWLGTQRR